jgi:hypothetical protein
MLDTYCNVDDVLDFLSSQRPKVSSRCLYRYPFSKRLSETNITRRLLDDEDDKDDVHDSTPAATRQPEVHYSYIILYDGRSFLSVSPVRRPHWDGAQQELRAKAAVEQGAFCLYCMILVSMTDDYREERRRYTPECSSLLVKSSSIQSCCCWWWWWLCGCDLYI